PAPKRRAMRFSASSMFIQGVLASYSFAVPYHRRVSRSSSMVREPPRVRPVCGPLSRAGVHIALSSECAAICEPSIGMSLAEEQGQQGELNMEIPNIRSMANRATILFLPFTFYACGNEMATEQSEQAPLLAADGGTTSGPD